ncbi:hypothetical protein ACTFIR_005707 [Dictyostelium discoideum]
MIKNDYHYINTDFKLEEFTKKVPRRKSETGSTTSKSCMVFKSTIKKHSITNQSTIKIQSGRSKTSRIERSARSIHHQPSERKLQGSLRIIRQVPSQKGFNFEVKLKDVAKVPKSRCYPVPLSTEQELKDQLTERYLLTNLPLYIF